MACVGTFKSEIPFWSELEYYCENFSSMLQSGLLTFAAIFLAKVI